VYFSGRADQSPTRKILAQARPGPTVGLNKLAQARTITKKARRASGRAASVNHIKSRPKHRAKKSAQARPKDMVGLGS
jgi:hypothetical protein